MPISAFSAHKGHANRLRPPLSSSKRSAPPVHGISPRMRWTHSGRVWKAPEAKETLRQLAIDNDEPSVRASTVRLLASTSTRQSHELAKQLLAAERRRSGPPRFALDILTNRIRPVDYLMPAVLGNRRLGWGEEIVDTRERVAGGTWTATWAPAVPTRCPTR